MTSASQSSVSGTESTETASQSTETAHPKGTRDTTADTTDSVQDNCEAKFETGPVQSVRPHSFSYNVHHNFNSPSASLQQPSSSAQVINSSSPASSAFLHLPVPSFSYNVGFTGSSQLQPQMPVHPVHNSSPAASLQPPVPGPPTRPSSFAQMQHSPNAANFPFNGNLQSFQKDQSPNSNLTAKSVHETNSNAPPVSLTPNMVPPSFWNPTKTGGTPTAIQSAPVNSSPTAAVHRQVMQPHPSQHQSYNNPYQTSPVGPHQHNHPLGPWLPPPQQLGRPQVLPYPPSFPGPFPLPVHTMPLPSVSLPDSRPPGVTSVGTTSTPSTSGPVVQPELPPGTDNSKHDRSASVNVGSVVTEQSDAWTAHRTESGSVYYYNALTGESTYEKPFGFKGQPDKVIAQPIPVSWEKLAGTDWAWVTTNDGKKYYYNTKTKLSSWQIPMEVTEFKKKQEVEALKEEAMISLQNFNNNLIEKSSSSAAAPISLNAPAVSTGGRESTALRLNSTIPASALDLIKKKLQDYPISASSGIISTDVNGQQTDNNTNNNSKDKVKDSKTDGNVSDSSSDSEDVESGPTKEECITQFKEMLKERGIAPFSKWDKELPKIVFDPRFKAIPGYSARRALFEHYVRTRAEEERKEKRAKQKAAIEGFKLLLEEAKEDINHSTDYQTFKRKWGSDPRFEALDRKERESLLNERVLSERATAVSSFKSMLREKGDITTSSRWSKVKDSLRNDPRYKFVNHDDREALYNEYLSELKSAEDETERLAKAKRDEEEKVKERERAVRKRKVREEQEVERVRSKARRKEAVESYQALLVESIKDPQVSWSESKAKLEKDPQNRAANPYLDQSDLEKLFREHVKLLYERCMREFRCLLSEMITSEAGSEESEDGKSVVNSWTRAKGMLKADPRYAKMPRKDRELIWRRHVERKQQKQDEEADKNNDRSYKRKR